jgi:hypothetical protein
VNRFNAVAAFMGRPSVISKDEVKRAPYIVKIRGTHIAGSAGDEIYARGIGSAGEGARYNVVHVGEALHDPKTHDLLGYRGVYVGTGPVATSGDPAKLKLNETTREALPGDKLFAESYTMSMDFAPHAPSGNVEASIIAMDGVFLVGRYQVIAISTGSKAGVNSGTVLAIHQAAETVKDVYGDGRSADPMNTSTRLFGGKVKLPSERIGTALVFKTYERMSYALIMDADHPVSIGDQVRNP